jgi:hypothetical protein
MPEKLMKLLMEKDTAVLNLEGYSIYALNDGFVAFHREELEYVGYADSLDEMVVGEINTRFN